MKIVFIKFNKCYIRSNVLFDYIKYAIFSCFSKRVFDKCARILNSEYTSLWNKLFFFSVCAVLRSGPFSFSLGGVNSNQFHSFLNKSLNSERNYINICNKILILISRRDMFHFHVCNTRLWSAERLRMIWCTRRTCDSVRIRCAHIYQYTIGTERDLDFYGAFGCEVINKTLQKIHGIVIGAVGFFIYMPLMIFLISVSGFEINDA